jgi:hypothetical protein
MLRCKNRQVVILLFLARHYARGAGAQGTASVGDTPR